MFHILYITHNLVTSLIDPILASSVDADPITRYTACEAIYNVVRVLRIHALNYCLDALFDFCFKLFNDVEKTVKSSANFLDRLLGEIYTESSNKHDVKPIIILIEKRIYTANTESRKFILSWIDLLFNLPNSNFITNFVSLLPGLFSYLTSDYRDLTNQTKGLLYRIIKLLKDQKKSQQFDHQGIIKVIAIHHSQFSKSNDLLTRLMVYRVLEATLINIQNDALVEVRRKTSKLIVLIIKDSTILSNSDEDLSIKQNKSLQATAISCNQHLHSIFSNWVEPEREVCTEIEKCLLGIDLTLDNKLTELTLNWLATVGYFNKKLDNFTNVDELLKSLCQLLLVNQHDSVMLKCITNCLCAFNTIDELSNALLTVYDKFCDERFYFILRLFFKIQSISDKSNLFLALVSKNRTNSFQLASLLNRLLQTCPELSSMRDSFHVEESIVEKIAENFKRSKCVSGLTCLYFWSGDYQKAAEVLDFYVTEVLSEQQVAELERIVDYLESPTFVKFRIFLMTGRESNKNFKICLFKLAAILPQSSVHFNTLKTRLLLSSKFNEI